MRDKTDFHSSNANQNCHGNTNSLRSVHLIYTRHLPQRLLPLWQIALQRLYSAPSISCAGRRLLNIQSIVLKIFRCGHHYLVENKSMNCPHRQSHSSRVLSRH